MGQLPKAKDCAPSVFLAAPTFASYPALPNPFQNGLQVRAVNYYLYGVHGESCMSKLRCRRF